MLLISKRLTPFTGHFPPSTDYRSPITDYSTCPLNTPYLSSQLGIDIILLGCWLGFIRCNLFLCVPT